MKIIKLIVLILVSLLSGAFVFLGYMGFFSPLEVKEEITGPYHYVYESFKGPYSSTGPVFDKVYKELEKDKITVTTKGIGIYYDDPAIVPQEELRSDCGVVVSDKELVTIKKMKKYHIGKIDKGRALVATFPLKNAISYMIGPMKGYPEIMSYAEKKGMKLAVPFELYDMEAKKIYYVMMLKE